MEVRIARRVLRLRVPLRSALARLAQRELLELTLVDGAGRTGRGEAAPLEYYDGVSLAAAERALYAYAPVLEGWDGSDRLAALAACRQIHALPQALAAVDVALWELQARRAGRPLAELLAAGPLRAVEVNATIGALEPAAAADAARAAADAGYRCVKVKVGVGDDAARVRAVREALGAEVALRLDANGAWSVPEALARLRALAPLGLECVEEPVHGVAALRSVARALPEVTVAMDETAAQPGAVGSGACPVVCLKLARSGGVSGLLAAAAQARAAGSDVYLASTMDGPVGIAAALHGAAALRPERACGLATLGLFEADQFALPVVEGHLRVPTEAGLGV